MRNRHFSTNPSLAKIAHVLEQEGLVIKTAKFLDIPRCSS